LLLQAAASLEEAHAKGLVHRDVKPSNIMVTERGGTRDFVKVLDFGLARQQLAPGATPERSVTFAGTPGYAAPEVIGGAAAGPAADVFSLGAVAYFLLAGRGPFSTASSTDALARTLSAEPEPLSSQTPDALSGVVRACLAKAPAERPASMAALAESLRAALGACTPWTRSDAEAWWRAHPRQHPPRGLSSPQNAPGGSAGWGEDDRGSVMRNVVPRPGALVSAMRPWARSTLP
jgi:serine/threonine-protein kinase